MKILKFSQQGFGLPQVLMAAGLVAGGALIVSQVNQRAIEDSRDRELKVHLADFAEEQKFVALVPEGSCFQQFGAYKLSQISDSTGEPINALTNLAGTTIYEAGTSTRNGVTWSSGRLHSYNPDTNQATFTREYTYSIGANKTKTKAVNLTIVITPDADLRRIDSCTPILTSSSSSGAGSGAAVGSGEVWTQDSAGISYSSGGVGIGQETITTVTYDKKAGTETINTTTNSGSVENLALKVYGDVYLGSSHNWAPGTTERNNSIWGGSIHTLVDSAVTNSALVAGVQNQINMAGAYNLIAGGNWNKIEYYVINTGSSSNSAIVGGAGNIFNTNEEEGYNFAAGANTSTVYGSYSTILGSYNSSTSNGEYSGVIGCNNCRAQSGTVVIGGAFNIGWSSSSSLIFGGTGHLADNATVWGVVIGGYANKIKNYTGYYPTIYQTFWPAIFAGRENMIDKTGHANVLLGGFSNLTSRANYSSIIGGYDNEISNTSDFYLSTILNGKNLKVTHAGNVMMGDSSSTTLTSSADNAFTARFSGGYRFCTNYDCSTGQTLSGSGDWTSISDKNVKENFSPIDANQILDILFNLDIPSWRYIAQPDKNRRTIGPMAQDFYQLFAKPLSLHSTDKLINQADINGFNLTAIKALEKESKKLEQENENLNKEMDSLKMRLYKIKQVLTNASQKQGHRK
jgi:hypothetical protein